MALQRKVKVAIPKPQPIPHNKGKQFMKMTEPERSVTMDAGVFDYLWRIVESRHEQAPQHHPEYVDLLERAVGCFRRAVGPVDEPIPLKAVRRANGKAAPAPVRRRVAKRA